MNIRRSVLLKTSLAGMLACAATLAIAPYAHADVTISTDATANMSCSGGVCSPTAADAVLNVTDLENYLASGNIEVTTTGSGVQANNLDITAPFSWSSASVLTLDAYQSITVDASVSIESLSGLTLTTNDGGKDGLLSTGDNGSVAFANLSSSLTINSTDYVLVGDIKTLASDIAKHPGGAFAFANPYDASVDGPYSSCPIPTYFTGQFDGLGNAIDNLYIDGPSKPTQLSSAQVEGLFADVGVGAIISNLRLDNITITTSRKYVNEGTIAGWFAGTITSSYVSGTLDLAKTDYGGGLVSSNGGVIMNSHSAVVIGGSTRETEAGGLATLNGGLIQDSYATGSVSSARSGGVVAENYAPGQVTSSFSTGSVSGSVAGGLAGLNFSGGSITNSYSTGAVAAKNYSEVGGLVGENASTISFSYSTGAVSAGTGSLIGGLIGDDTSTSGSLDDTYWDVDTSGITNPDQGAGNVADDPGITGLTTTQFQSGLPIGFDPAVWGEKKRINHGFPYILAIPPKK